MKTESTPWHDLTPPLPGGERARGVQSLYTRAQLEAVLGRERARADRIRGEFSMVVFRTRGEEPHATAKLARMLLRRARATDELGWFDPAAVAVLLPYTCTDGARIFAEASLKQAQAELIPAICRIYTYPSAWYFNEAANPHGANGSENGSGTSNGNGSGNGQRNGNGHGHDHDNGRGNGHGGGKAISAERRMALAPTDLVPYVLQGMADGLEVPHAGEADVTVLLVRPLPWWKRAVDIAGASAGLVALSPIMILAAILIRGTSAGPVIFKQRRAGIGGRPFWIYKFRTMIDGAEAQKAALRGRSEQDGPAFKLSDDPRLTPIGRVLRETSLDELPQLWNVLKGDMSLVGPRPLPMDEAAECQQWQRRRLDVTPGLTCIWQVRGRSRVTFAEWMRMDVAYIRRRTFLHDMKILMQTIPAVLLRRGAK